MKWNNMNPSFNAVWLILFLFDSFPCTSINYFYNHHHHHHHEKANDKKEFQFITWYMKCISLVKGHFNQWTTLQDVVILFDFSISLHNPFTWLQHKYSILWKSMGSHQYDLPRGCYFEVVNHLVSLSSDHCDYWRLSIKCRQNRLHALSTYVTRDEKIVFSFALSLCLSLVFLCILFSESSICSFLCLVLTWTIWQRISTSEPSNHWKFIVGYRY